MTTKATKAELLAEIEELKEIRASLGARIIDLEDEKKYYKEECDRLDAERVKQKRYTDKEMSTMGHTIISQAISIHNDTK